jgi:hypothetical protein
VTETNVQAVSSILAQDQQLSESPVIPHPEKEHAESGELEETPPQEVMETSLLLEDATDERCTQAEAGNMKSVATETIQ